MKAKSKVSKHPNYVNASNPTEQRMFDWLEGLVHGPAAKVAWNGKQVTHRYMALALTEFFGITFPQARSIRDRWLKLRKQEARHDG